MHASWKLAPALLALVATPTLASAQIVIMGGGGGGGTISAQGQAQIGQAIQDALGAAIGRALSRRATLSPTLGTVDAKTQQVTFTLENVGDDTLDVDLTMSATAPAQPGADTANAASPLVADDASSKADDSTHSLVPWVTGLAKSVTLLPHAKQAVTLSVKPPTGTAAGEYSGWVVAESSARQSKAKADEPTFVVNGPDGKPVRPKAASKVVYKVQ